MLTISAFAETAALIGDPARAAMLAALMDGRALTAGELARAAGIAPQTASGHLARLTESGLLTVVRQGRHRYHRVASAAVAHMLETVMAVAAERGDKDGRRVRPPAFVGPRDQALRRARTCYDHLAGRLAVAIADRMVAQNHVEITPDGGALTGSGLTFLGGLGIGLGEGRGRSGARPFCRPCLDWSERRPHLAGTVGAALCKKFFERGWIRRIEGSRAVDITQAGRVALREVFGLGLDP